MTIQLSVATIVYVFSCITIVGGAIKILYQAKKAVMKPLEEVNEKLKKHDEFFANDKRKLDSTDAALEDLTEAVSILVKGQKVILEHLRDGNHTGEIKQEEKDLDAWLLKRRQNG